MKIMIIHGNQWIIYNIVVILLKILNNNYFPLSETFSTLTLLYIERSLDKIYFLLHIILNNIIILIG